MCLSPGPAYDAKDQMPSLHQGNRKQEEQRGENCGATGRLGVIVL